MDKRGLSEIIVVVLIVLVSVAAVFLFYAPVKALIEQSDTGPAEAGGVEFSIESVKMAESCFDIRIMRNYENEDTQRIRFIFKNSSISSYVDRNDLLSELEEKTFVMCAYGNLSNLTELIVAPIIDFKGEEMLGAESRFVIEGLISGVDPVEESQSLYISLEGNDGNEGSLNAPLRSLEGARDKIRVLREEGLDKPVTVYLREGNYFITSPFELTSLDAAEVGKEVTYQSYPLETAEISGGIEITGTWTRVGGYDYYKTNVGSLRFNSLFINGERKTKARLPDEGFYFIVNRPECNDSVYYPYVRSGVEPPDHYCFNSFNFSSNQIDSSWRNIKDIEIVSQRRWQQAISRLDSVQGNRADITGDIDYYWGWERTYRGGDRYYVQNVFEGLSEGEWYLDNSNGDLYYWPLSGENIEDKEIIIPVTYALVKLLGANNTRFKNLVFSYTDWNISSTGYPPEWPHGRQSAIGLDKKYTALDLRNSENIVLENNIIKNIGGMGIRSVSKNVVMNKNQIYDIGAGGIFVSESTIDLGYGNTIIDNTIHDVGKVFSDASAVYVYVSPNNIVSHNLVYNAPYTGISVGLTGSAAATRCKNNTIEYNEVYNVMQQLNDGGGIYVKGNQPGTVVRNNIVHDIPGNFKLNSYPVYIEDHPGLYPDGSASNMIFENNLVYRTVGASLNFNINFNNTFRNNIFVDARDYFIAIYPAKDATGLWPKGNIFTNNIVYSNFNSTAKLFYIRYFSQEDPTSSVNYSDYNLYYSINPSNPNWNLNWWKSSYSNFGYDVNSLETDPLFVDYENDNFALQPNSEAFSLGFQQIDFSRVGPRS